MEEIKYPTKEEIQKEYKRVKGIKLVRSTLVKVAGVIAVVSAMAVLVATLWMPVLQIYGSSMSPTLKEKNYVVTTKKSTYNTGDIIAFYYNNKILVKRVIAVPGDWFDMDYSGKVFVNGEPIDEPYLTESSFEPCDIRLPYQVQEDTLFVLGDNRSVSIDSRSSAVGAVAYDSIVGKLTFCVWPIKEMGAVK